MRVRRAIAAASLAAIGGGLLPLVMAQPATATSQPEVVASGLHNPYKIRFGSDGKLYVAEGGTGGSSNCVTTTDPETGEQGTTCAGNTGSVAQIDPATKALTRPVTGLASIGQQGSVDGAFGPTNAVRNADGTYTVLFGLGGDTKDRGQYGTIGAQLGTIQSISTSGTPTTFADLADFEAKNNPDKTEPTNENKNGLGDSDPYGFTLTSGGKLLVADAGGNDLLDATGGTVNALAVLPFQDADAPPFIQPPPPGGKVRVQPVPTSVVQGPDGSIYVTELTGFPFPPGAANIYKLGADNKTLTVAYSGFTNIVDMAFGPDGTPYVLEYSGKGLLNEEGIPQSEVIQLRKDGSRKTVLSAEIPDANGIAIGPDGMIYVAHNSQSGTNGEVLRADPNVARDPAAASACPPAKVPGSGFTDVAANTHQETVECMAWWKIVNGETATSFGPNDTITRGQVSAIIVGILKNAGYQLNSNPPAAFTDTKTGTFALPINQLAAAGLAKGYGDGSFRPNNPVNRGELATLMARAYNAVSKSTLATSPDAFDDDNGTVYEPFINGAAAKGWARGTGPRTYAPLGKATRGQVATFAARLLSTLVDEKVATLPS